jgi:hypothetical protein
LTTDRAAHRAARFFPQRGNFAMKTFSGFAFIAVLIWLVACIPTLVAFLRAVTP